jgi:hypothetical protein
MERASSISYSGLFEEIIHSKGDETVKTSTRFRMVSYQYGILGDKMDAGCV